jgi:hypothetical protein
MGRWPMRVYAPVVLSFASPTPDISCPLGWQPSSTFEANMLCLKLSLIGKTGLVLAR